MNTNENQALINEKMLARYYELSMQAKEIDKELQKLKKTFNQFFDLTVGEKEKGEVAFDQYTLTRQIRVSEKYREQEAVQKLEELQLSDCIRVEKKVDEDKVNAAITLGLLQSETLDSLKDRKHTAAIYVKKL